MKFKIPSIFKNIYVLILLLFAIWMVFFDSNSTLVHLELNEQINELKKETEYYKNEIEKEGIDTISKKYEAIVNFIQTELKW